MSVYTNAGGGGASSEELTSRCRDVVKGKTAITMDSGDEPAEGTLELTGNAADSQVLKGQGYYNTDPHNKRLGSMENRGGWKARIGVNGKAAIPAGYHNGSGYVDQAITNRGAVNASLGINGTYMIPEGYHNGAGKVSQRITTMGAQTITPGNTQKVVSCSGKYMTGNVTVPAVSNLTAENIKKGVTVGGVTGTWQGFVQGSGDIYNQGTLGLATGFTSVPYHNGGTGAGWISAVPSKLTYETGHITLRAGYVGSLFSDNPIDLTGFSTLNIEFITSRGSPSYNILGVAVNKLTQMGRYDSYDTLTNFTCAKDARKTVSLDIAAINGYRYIGFCKWNGGVDDDNLFGRDDYYIYVYRIWMT